MVFFVWVYFFIYFFTLASLPGMAFSHQTNFKALMVYFFAVPSPKHELHFSASFLS